jgi:putative transposase
MEQQRMRKTFKYKLKPAPVQERGIERAPLLCRPVDNAAVGERREAWRMRDVSVASSQQKAESPSSKEAMPEYAEVNAQVSQDAALRRDRAFAAFFHRIRAGQRPGSPRFHGRDRYNSFTCPQVGDHGGARVDNGFLVLSKIGRIAVRWSRPLEGDAQDRHDFQRGGRVVCLFLLRGCIRPAAARDGAGDGRRPWR